MFRKISETFTATHLTIMFVAALMVPGAVYATVATTAVSITDPNTGQKSFVDAARRLSVYDATAGFANSPTNYVRVSLACGTNTPYSPPSGKALIIKSASMFYYGGTQGSDNYVYLVNNNTSLVIAAVEGINISDALTAELGNGYYIKGSEVLDTSCGGVNGGAVSVVGYLVPSTSVPATGTAQELAQSFPAGRASPPLLRRH